MRPGTPGMVPSNGLNAATTSSNLSDGTAANANQKPSRDQTTRVPST